MTKTCAVLPKDINRAYTTQTKMYMDQGLASQQARSKAAQDFINALNSIDSTEEVTTLGSTSNMNNQHPYTEVIREILNRDNIETIYERLGQLPDNNKLDPIDHKNHLQNVMKTFIYPLIGRLNNYTFQLTTSEVLDEAKGTYDSRGYIQVHAAKNPALNRLHLSLQEIAAHEFVHAITEAAYRSGDYALRKGIDSLYELAKSKLTPDIFAEPGSTPEANKERFDYIFNNEKGVGPLEFMAFGLTNAKLITALQGIKLEKPTNANKTLWDKISNLFQTMVDYFTKKTLHIKGDTADKALWSLVQELSGVQERQKNLIDIASNVLEYSKDITNRGINLIIDPLIDWVNKPNAKQNIIRTSIKTWNNWKVLPIFGKFYMAVAETANNIIKHREYFLFNLVQKLPQELIGMNATNKAWHDLLKYSKDVVEGARHRMKESVISYVRDTIGTMDDVTKSALTYALINTDADDLLTYDDKFTFEDYRKVFSDDTELQKRIDENENLLVSKFGITGNAYIRQANGLGMFMVRKKTINKEYQMMNAHRIAIGHFDPKFKRPENWEGAIPIIQRLKTLHAIRYSKKEHREAAVKFYDSQLNLPEGTENGFNTLLSLNLGFKKLSLEKLFNNDPLQVVAGYTKDLNSRDLMIEYSSKKNDKDLLDRGYVMQKEPLGQHDYVPGKKHYIYIAPYNGLVTFQKMVASLTSRQAAGTTLTDLYVADGMTYRNATIKADQITQSIKFQTSKKTMYSRVIDESDTSTLIPLLNNDGKIINFRYVMTEQHRVDYLQKDTRIDNVLGAMYESITDKEKTLDVNQKVVDEIINEHKTLYPKKPKGFITVTKNHPKYGEIYSLLPEEMKGPLNAYFGKGKIVVRESMMDIIFGYRKYSLFTEGDNSWVARLMKTIIIDLARVSPGKYYRYGRATEQGIQQLVQEIKKVIVLKTPVLFFNILSNGIISFMHGMPLNYITKNQGEAILAVEDYTKKHRKMLILERKLDTIGLSKEGKDNIKAEIAKLKFYMDNSPIKPLIDEHLLNSIVEDITVDDNDFGIKGDLFKYLVNKTKWIPAPVKTAYDYAYITPKTGLYKLLEKSTRYSDFVARHAMYKWYIEEKKVSKQEALQIVTETFVNYDLPTSAELQYLNDIGLYMFTKYALRIQKTIYRLMRDNPKSVLALAISERIVGNITDPTDQYDLMFGLPDNPVKSVQELFVPGWQLARDLIP